MSDIKKIGRPRSFDYEEALSQAMNVFWEKGFNGASIRDLTKAMGIPAPSLYSAFGDKQELFLKAIDLYSDGDNCEPIVALETEEDIETAIIRFFEAIIQYATEHESGAKGCFLASCATTSVGQVEGVGSRIRASIVDTEIRLAARFDREIAKGTLPASFPSLERAAMMFDLRQGYIFRGRAGVGAKELKRGLEERARMLVTS